MPARKQVWAGDIVQINKRAVQDSQSFEPCITVRDGWRLEMMSMDRSKCAQLAGDTAPDNDLSSDERKFRAHVDDELDRSLIANLRREGFRTPV
jgi:hypothetical protein